MNRREDGQFLPPSPPPHDGRIEDMTPISSKSIAAFWTQATEGARLTCLDNNQLPDSIGATGIVWKPGKTAITLKREDGKYFYINPPQRVRDIVNLTDDTITYCVNGCPEHTATWKIEVAS